MRECNARVSMVLSFAAAMVIIVYLFSGVCVCACVYVCMCVHVFVVCVFQKQNRQFCDQRNAYAPLNIVTGFSDGTDLCTWYFLRVFLWNFVMNEILFHSTVIFVCFFYALCVCVCVFAAILL